MQAFESVFAQKNGGMDAILGAADGVLSTVNHGEMLSTAVDTFHREPAGGFGSWPLVIQDRRDFTDHRIRQLKIPIRED